MGESSVQQIQKRKTPFLGRLLRWFRRLGLWNQIAIVVLLLSVPMGWVGIKLLKPVYKNWKQQNALRIADRYLAANDVAGASLAFRKAIGANPRNPEVWRKVAQFLDGSNSPEIITVWERLVRLEPGNVENRYRLIESAIKFGRWRQAQEAMEALPESARTGDKYYRLVADLAIAKQDYAAAETALVRLREAAPADAVAFRLNAVRLKLDDAGKRADAHAYLEALALQEDEPRSADAMRILIEQALREKDVYGANLLAGKLIARPGATVQDRLMHLDTEFATKSFTVPNSIGAVQKFAEQHPDDLPVVVRYFSLRNLRDQAKKWLGSLPPEIASLPSTRTAVLEIAVEDRDWPLVFQVLRDENSPMEIDPGVVDLVESAFRQYDAGDTAADETWQKALYAAENRPQNLRILMLFAKAKGWMQAAGKAGWALAAHAAGNPDVWRQLAAIEQQQENYGAVLRALAGLRKADPYDPAARANWVLLSVLLKSGDPRNLVQVAREAHEAEPGNPVYLTAYAMALRNAGQAAEAADLIDRLSGSERKEPSRALYIGAVLASAGRGEDAREYLARAEKFLPTMSTEERFLLAETISAVQGDASVAEIIAKILERRELTEEEFSRMRESVKNRQNEQLSGEARQQLLESLKFEQGQRSHSPEEILRLLRITDDGNATNEF